MSPRDSMDLFSRTAQENGFSIYNSSAVSHVKSADGRTNYGFLADTDLTTGIPYDGYVLELGSCGVDRNAERLAKMANECGIGVHYR